MSARGFTLIELLVATLLALTICGALAGIATGIRSTFDRNLGAGDLATRGRSGLSALVAELRQAGAGVAIDAAMLADVAPVTVPNRSLTDTTIAAPYGAIAVISVPALAAQGRLRARALAGTTVLTLDVADRCAGGDPCGFQSRTPAVVYDRARAESLVIATTAPGGVLTLTTPLPAAFDQGAIVAAVESSVYGLRADADGAQQLVRITRAGAEQPIVDHVVDFEVRVFGSAVPPIPSDEDNDPPTYGPTPPAMGVDDDREGWPPGENCIAALDADGHRQPRLASLGAPTALIELASSMVADGPWCADPAAAAPFDADLLRIRRVDLRLRVEAASAAWRGPVARLFARPGTARHAARWVPDVELHASVMLRNR